MRDGRDDGSGGGGGGGCQGNIILIIIIIIRKAIELFPRSRRDAVADVLTKFLCIYDIRLYSFSFSRRGEDKGYIAFRENNTSERECRRIAIREYITSGRGRGTLLEGKSPFILPPYGWGRESHKSRTC